MEAFAIFEGGGVKGLAHVGALKAVEGRVEFIGVAGSSAGAIVAALVSAGYTADELYRLVPSRGGIMDIDYPYHFFGYLRWEEWKRFVADFKKTFCGVSMLTAWRRVPLFYLKHCHVILRLQEEQGIFSTRLLEDWVNTKLLEKVRKTEQIGKDEKQVLFKHLRTPLKIVASNITGQCLEVYSQETEDGMMPVSKAVARSACIPFFFQPGRDGKDTVLVDGGILSNFPAWLFDRERRTSKAGPLTPTLGFRLITEVTEGAIFADAFAGRLLYALIAGDLSLEIREVESLHVIPLKVKVDTTDFDLTPEERDELYTSGLHEAERYLVSVQGPKEFAYMQRALAFVAKRLLNVIGKDQKTHLRANIALRTTRQTLRITYSYNMEEDPDDRLEFEIGSGACGLAWVERDITYCDLELAKVTYKDTWKMTKYQQALVCRDAKSLLCIPMFQPPSVGPQQNASNAPLIGVLNFDSKDDIKVEFSDRSLDSSFLEIGSFMAEVMQESVEV